jgi:hypothetical protein
MMEHLLIPGMQDGQKANLCSEVTRVRRDREEGFGYGAESMS